MLTLNIIGSNINFNLYECNEFWNHQFSI
jgi:hypothetical protein